jgi:hypothetical protein
MRYNYKKKGHGISALSRQYRLSSKVACRMTGIKITKEDKGKMYMIYRITRIILNGTSTL